MIKKELQSHLDYGLNYIGPDNSLDLFDYEVPNIPIIPGYEETEEQRESIKKYFEDMKNGIEPEIVKTIIEEPIVLIQDTYQHYIDQIPNGKIDITFEDMMIILRWVEKKLGNGDIPMNFSCESCIVSLVQLFSDLKNK